MRKQTTIILSAILAIPSVLMGAEGDIVIQRENSAGVVRPYDLAIPASAGFLSYSSTNPSWRTYAQVLSDLGVSTTAQIAAAYQPLDTQLTSLAGLSYTGNTLKVVRVNAVETAFELVTLAGGGDALVASPLSQFAATTSAQLAGVISDETGTGVLVFGTSPELTSATVATSFYPTVSNGVALGDATHQFADLFLNSGGVINFDNGDATLTHSANTLTLDGAHLHVNAAFIDIEDAGETITVLADGRIVFDPGANTTTLDFGASPTGNRTITLPDLTGTVALLESPSFVGTSNVGNGATSSGILRITEDTDDGANYATIQVPALAANTVYVLPADDGDAGEQLQTNGTGTLSWEAAGSGGVSDGATLATGLTFPIAGLHILDTNASHDLILSPGSDLTADKTLTITTGDSDRTLDISAGSVTITAAGATLVDDADASAQRTTLGLAIGTNVQAYDADLTTYAGITPAANTQTLLAGADYAAWRTSLGLVIGTNVQAYDGELAALAGLVSAADRIPYFTGSGTASLLDLTTLATLSGTQIFTNKTLDASATGNVVKMFGYLVLTHPHVFGAGVVQQTTVTNNQYGQALFSNSVDKATNYVEYYMVVPPDVDTAVDLTGTFKIQLSAGDTGDHEYEISFDSVANSGAYAGTLGDPISLAYTADASGAANDVETAGETTLTGWRSAMTAGQLMVVRVARDGDHASDTSTVNSYSGPLVIKYPITQ